MKKLFFISISILCCRQEKLNRFESPYTIYGEGTKSVMNK